ncbi:DegT/DnrJ/EryC1/StrS aminotransferase family protein [bacterium]|nr:DegT/DnrJ/EryC1/StrS aminotransferase family protein [bacterium]
MIAHSKPTLGVEEVKIMAETIASGDIAQGTLVQQFEKKTASFIGTKYAVALNCGTSALHLALLSLDIKNNNEVIIPSFTCTALLNAIHYTGAKAVLADIDIEDYNISVSEIKKKLTRKTKAIIVPHMFGHPVDLAPILNLGPPVIEDCAHSIGAIYNNKKTGSFGLLSIFSFYATKMMTTGEGGMVLTNSSILAKKVRDLRDYDEKSNYATRYNYKMTDLHAGIGIKQLSNLTNFIKRRQQIEKQYTGNLSGKDIILPAVKKNCTHVFYRYVIRIRQGSRKFIKNMLKNNVVCCKPVYRPIHRYLKLGGFPNSEKAWRQAVSIPIYPSLSNENVKVILNNILKYTK